jgi:DNA-directed RNA polymerase specialized sigma24 family protein
MAAASDKEREIHALILAKDDLAFARLCDEYYETVFNKVKNFNPDIYKADDTLLADVITDVFLKYFQRPERYQPERQSLEYFLVMDAEGDLKNAWQKLKRQEKKFPNSVELDKKSGNSGIEDDEFDPFERLIDKEAGALLDKTLHGVLDSETDVLVAQLMLAGERRSSEYARVMNIGHLPEEAQRLQIKQQKDRVDKVIRRKLRNRSNDG